MEELNDATASKANDHTKMSFKQFKPLNLKPNGFTTLGQTDKMKEFISKLVEQNEKELKLDLFKQWLESFDTKSINTH